MTHDSKWIFNVFLRTYLYTSFLPLKKYFSHKCENKNLASKIMMQKK